jgi:hypothetical protein
MRAFFILLFLAAPDAHAHPVAYQGSTGVMGFYSGGMMDFEVNHSLRYWFAPAVQVLRFTENTSKPDYFLGKLNFLAYRKNGEDYQANLYLHAGAGRSSERGVFHYGVTADAENRRVYFLGQWDSILNSARTERRWWKLRAGFAPYLAGFEGVHSWLILEANQKIPGRVSLVPTLRFFYQNVLWEIGSSLDGEIHFNHIIHF